MGVVVLAHVVDAAVKNLGRWTLNSGCQVVPGPATTSSRSTLLSTHRWPANLNTRIRQTKVTFNCKGHPRPVRKGPPRPVHERHNTEGTSPSTDRLARLSRLLPHFSRQARVASPLMGRWPTPEALANGDLPLVYSLLPRRPETGPGRNAVGMLGLLTVVTC